MQPSAPQHPTSGSQRLVALPAIAVTLVLVLILAACGGGSGDGPPTIEPTAANEPAATEVSATAIPSATQEFGYRLVRTLPAADFDNMLGFVAIPGEDDEAVVLTQDGQIWRASFDDDEPPALFADLSERVIDNASFEEGLLGLAFSPDFETDRRVFVHYTAGRPRRGRISWFGVVDGSLDVSDEHIVIEVAQPFPNHNGGQIAFGTDGYLYIALGDGGFSELRSNGAASAAGNAQDLSTLLGSILRLDVSGEDGYEIPADNPFVDTPGARPEIYAYGLRNPWRFSFDRETGDLWAADVGQSRWEETDRVVAGGNYGWDVLEGFECFQAEECETAGFIPPRSVHTHFGGVGVAVIGGFVYRGSALPELDGWYIYGDFGSGFIWAVNTADDSPRVILTQGEWPISSFGETADGEPLVITFANAIFSLERVE